MLVRKRPAKAGRLKHLMVDRSGGNHFSATNNLPWQEHAIPFPIMKTASGCPGYFSDRGPHSVQLSGLGGWRPNRPASGEVSHRSLANLRKWRPGADGGIHRDASLIRTKALSGRGPNMGFRCSGDGRKFVGSTLVQGFQRPAVQ